MFKKNKKRTATELEQQAITTVIGPDIKIVGNLTGENAVRVDGTIEGNVTIKNGVILGDRSTVRGNLQSDYVVIYGQLQGNIEAKGLYLKNTGVIQGDIHVESIEIELGGKYNGKLNMQATAEVIKMESVSKKTMENAETALAR